MFRTIGGEAKRGRVVSASAPRAAIVVNPISGAGRDQARPRAEYAVSLAARCGIDAEVFVTERAGHARQLARAARDRGIGLVVAWGGDGTVNEVGSALAFGDARMAIVPAGSGNGLARELGVPADPEAAFQAGFEGRERAIDAGELDGHLFFNVAGVGLDAQVAHRFAGGGRGRRGPARYILSVCRELLAFAPSHCIVEVGEAVRRVRPMLIAVANSRQYGNGAVIAPQARLDDGRLDVVIVEYRPLWRTALQMRRLFNGRIAELPGVMTHAVARLTIRGAAPIRYHVDGEPCVGERTLVGRVHPRALTVRTPA